MIQVMEDSRQQNEIFMVGSRALLQDLQSVSSPHLTVLLVVSCPLFVSIWPIGLLIAFLFESMFIFFYTANSIKVEFCSDDESPGAPQAENKECLRDDSGNRGEPVEEGTGIDRVSIYSEMSSPKTASPGPIRLANGRLQCEVCGMICIGPNVLMVHKRSHTGESKQSETAYGQRSIIILMIYH